jgi:hypothetical protein
MNKSTSFKVILALAFLQGVAGVLRASNWVQIGADLFRQGLLLMPFVGMLAVMHGILISAVALLFFLFVVCALWGKSWARWPGIIAAIANLLIALSALVQGAAVLEVIAWSVIPVLLVFYLFSDEIQRHDKASY